MRKILIILSFLLSYSVSAQVNIYISPSGNDTTGTGAIDAPFRTPQPAIEIATPGDTVNFRGGTYYSKVISTIDPEAGHGYTGKEDSLITYRSYPGEWAIFDCGLHCSQPSPPAYNGWLSIQHSEHLKFQNFEVRNVFQCRVPNYGNSGVIGASYSRNLTFEHIIIHDISTPRGYSISGGAWKTWTDNRPQYGDDGYWSSSEDTTRFINCDVYNTCDTLGGGNAGDGWKIVYYGNNYIEFDGCRVWNFSDDGIDPNSIDGAEYVVKNSWFMSTQKYERFDIEGNGMKFTAMYDNYSIHSDKYPFVKFWDNIVADNNYYGYYDNLYVGGSQHLNTQYIGNVSYKNYYGIRANVDAALGDSSSSNLKNNIAFLDDNRTSGNPYPARGSGNNFLTSNYTDRITLTEWDFLSVDLGELIKTRKADGSLPDVNLFRPRNGSQLINAGSLIVAADSSLYERDSSGVSALAPDIGPWEYVPTAEDTNEDILSFTFPNQSGYTTYDYDNNEIHATIYYANRGTLTSLVPIVLPSDNDTISPGFGATVNFSTQPQVFRVSNIATPAQYEDWDVYIDTAVGSSYADIRTFYLNNFTYGINKESNTVAVYYQPGSSISNLAPRFTLDRGATSDPASKTIMAFTGGEQAVTVTAEDGSEEAWTLTIDELTITDTLGILGYTLPFTEVRTTTRTFYSRYVATETSRIDTLAIYHWGGGGNMIAGVYDTYQNASDDPAPRNKLAETAAPVAVNATAGWQKIALDPSDNLTENFEIGDTVWLAFAFQNGGSFATIENMPFFGLNCYYDSYGYGYSWGLRNPAETSQAWGFIASTYAIYESLPLDSTQTDIISFILDSQTGDATINATNHTVAIEVEYGTDVTGLQPEIVLSSGATVSPVSGAATNFTSPVTYTVTALNGTTTQEWVITVTIADAPPSVPAIYTTAVTRIRFNRASSGGYDLYSEGAITAKGVCWSTSANPTVSDSKTVSGTGVDFFEGIMTGLLPNTTYHVRAYATNQTGTGYGSDISFTTSQYSRLRATKSIMYNGKKVIIR